MNFYKTFLFFSGVICVSFAIGNQPPIKDIDLSPPVKIPIFLAGNFGELRAGHFHAGIDIKTYGSIGQPIYSVADGYVSRINISSGGYGNALYITHTNGLTTVYGHLDRFTERIANYTLKQQYKKRSFEIDMYLTPGQLPVSKDELIAYSGNTGYSGGPHLHFEVRTSSDQVPQNVLLYGFDIKDTIPPQLKQIFIYQKSDTNSNVTLTKKAYALKPGKTDTYQVKYPSPIPIPSTFAIGIEGYDYLNQSLNRCGIYSFDLRLDNQPVFAFQIDEVPFSITRDINSHMDYAEKKVNKISVHKLFREPQNRLNLYTHNEAKGVINIHDSLEHKITITAKDIYGNTSMLEFQVQRNGKSTAPMLDSSWLFASSYRPLEINAPQFNMTIPSKGLYTDALLSYSCQTDSMGQLKEIAVLPEYTPFRNAATIRLKIPQGLRHISSDKLLIARINENQQLENEAGKVTEGWIETTIRQLGRFCITADTIPPLIKVMNFHQGVNYKENQEISFEITDNLSGIESYNGYIDNKWVLFRYDAKNDALYYTIDSYLFKTGQKRELKLYVMDKKNNMSVFTSYFIY